MDLKNISYKDQAVSLSLEQCHDRNIFFNLPHQVCLELQYLYFDDPIILSYMDEIKINVKAGQSMTAEMSAKSTAREIAPLQAYDIDKLSRMGLTPPEFIVEGLLPCGIVILAAPSKIGKSWMALDLCLSVAIGDNFLGFKTNKHDVVYFALEDSLYRINDRIDKIIKGKKRPDNVKVVVKSANMMNGFLDQLDILLKDNPKIKLVIIDTLQKIKPPSSSRQTAYEQDYKQLGEIKELADHYNVCILLIHHTRKGNGYDGDAFEKILGSTALQGASDTMLVITKDKRTDETAVLIVTGRDVAQQELCVSFDNKSLKWMNKGFKEGYDEKRMKVSYESDPVIITIKKLVNTNDFWEGTMLEIQENVIHITGKVLPESGNALAKKIKKLAPHLSYFDNIEYRASEGPVWKDGKTKRLHSFQKYHLLE